MASFVGFLTAWWTRDTALHTFVLCNFLIGLPFFVFNTYVIYQLQVVGFLIGADADGLPCTTYCIVPWVGEQMDLNSVLLYLNAFAFGLGGACTMFLSAYSDFWSRKHLLVTFFILCYGVLSIPAYWLQAPTNKNFQSLTGLYIVFNVVTLILIAVLNIYIPHCMRKVSTGDDINSENADQQQTVHATAKRKYGFNMSVFGAVANGVGGIIVYVAVIILSETLSGTASQSSGLLVTTIVGFITAVGSAAAYYGLPAIPSKTTTDLRGSWTRPIIEFLMPFKDLATHKNMAALLVSYTIYTDTTFAVSSVITQLFVTEIRPSTLEISLFALAQSLFLIGCTLVFLWIQPCFRIRLETWLICGYALMILVPVWACIGLADVNFGFKTRWEFYAQHFVLQTSAAFVNMSFRVLFSEMIPVKNEVRWFGMQLIFSCATVWVNYVASAPLQNATHQLRFPMVVSLLFLLVAFAIEVARVSLPAFKADARKWRRRDRTAAVNDDQGVVAEEEEDSSSNNSASDAVVPERYNVGVGGEKA